MGLGMQVANPKVCRTIQQEAEEMKRNLSGCLKNQKGITLLEVMISMLILAFGVLGLAPMLVVSMFGNSYSNQVTVADAIAMDRFEEIKTWYHISPLPFSETVNNVQRIFTRETQIDDSTTDGSIPPGVYRIQITVSWTDQEQVPRSVTYHTYKAKT
jgi:type II secretory pathway pseudopilin PulG